MIAHICNVVFNICVRGHRYVRYVYTVILSTKCNPDLAHVMLYDIVILHCHLRY